MSSQLCAAGSRQAVSAPFMVDVHGGQTHRWSFVLEPEVAN
jgi:hypothetical protein